MDTINQFITNIILSLNNRWNSNISLDNIINFIFLNKYILIFLILIWIGICFDSRILLGRKIVIPLMTLLFVFSLIFFRGNLLWNDIFWYTFMLNGSMIFHSLLCEWLFKFFMRLNLEYGAFIVSRISFVLSLSFIKYLVEWVTLYIELIVPDYNDSLTNEKLRKIIFLLGYYLLRLILIIDLILLFFISLYSEYVNFVLGFTTKEIKFNRNFLKAIIKFICIFLLTIFISIYILGIPRLYFLWIIWSLSYIFNIFISLKFDVYNKFWYKIENDVIFKTRNAHFLYIYSNTNSKLFNYGFYQFINYRDVIINGLPMKFHLKSPFKYYSKEALILTYVRCFCKYFRLTQNEFDIKFNNIIPDQKDRRGDNYYIYNNQLRVAIHGMVGYSIPYDLSLEELNYWNKKIKKLFRKRTLIADFFFFFPPNKNIKKIENNNNNDDEASNGKIN